LQITLYLTTKGHFELLGIFLRCSSSSSRRSQIFRSRSRTWRS